MERLAGVRRLEDLTDTRALAERMAAKLEPGTVLLLTGELGSGKTAFTQALAAGLGVGEAITSPTFTIAAEYTASHPRIGQLVHVDLYRLAQVAGEDQAYLHDLLASAASHNQAVVIEWADRLNEAPEGAWKMHFEHGTNPRQRIVTITAPPHG